MSLTKTQEVKILKKIIDIASTELDLSLVLKQIIEIVSEVTEADSVFIYLFDEQKDLVLQASKTPHKKELGKIKLKIGEGITGWVAKQNKAVCIKKNAYQDPRFKCFDVLPEDKYEAFFSTPICYKNKTIGVINIQHKNLKSYSPSLINLINTIGKQVGGVIENAQLYKETKQKAKQFDTLVKISESINSEKYLQEILDLIVIVTAELLNSKICAIMLLDEEKQNLVIKATHTLSEAYKQKPPVNINNSLSGEALKQKKPLPIYDVTTEKKYFYRDLAKKEGLSSALLVPMFVKEKPIGIVNIYTKQPHHFSLEEINILQIIANQAAVAIEKTKLIDEASKAKEALEARKIIEKAKGILMKNKNLNEEDAYQILRKKSMDSCRSMKDIAEAIIFAAECGL